MFRKKYENIRKFHWKIISDYPVRQGKYLRPTLVLLVTKAMGSREKDAVKTAAAMQTSEDWILNHDDIEDNSVLRRGKPCLHKIHGIELAINAGDALQSVMWKILIDNFSVFNKSKSLRLMNEFYKLILRTSLGQTAEIKWSRENKIKISDADWFFIADSKSAYYSITAPLRLGAIIANGTEKQLDQLSNFGLYLGRVYQLVDDILDVTSDFKGLKQRASDIYEGKRTLMLGHLLRKVKGKDRQKIISILKKTREQKTKKEVNWIIDKMHQYKSIEYARKIAKDHKEKAKKIFDEDLKFLSKQPARKHLEQIIDFILEREY